MMVCAAMTCWFALRQLDIHSNKAPVVDDTLRYRQTAEIWSSTPSATS